MARKRFSTTEKAVISANAANPFWSIPSVEWQNVTQWHPAKLVTGEIITESDGWQYVEAINLASTPTLTKGQVIHVSPGHIRAIPSTAPNGATEMQSTDSNPAQGHTTVSDLTGTGDVYTPGSNAPTAFEKAGGAPASDDNASDGQNGHHGYGKRKFDQGFAAGRDSLRMDVRAVLNDMGSDTSADDLAQAIADAIGLDFEPAAE